MEDKIIAQQKHFFLILWKKLAILTRFRKENLDLFKTLQKIEML